MFKKNSKKSSGSEKEQAKQGPQSKKEALSKQEQQEQQDRTFGDVTLSSPRKSEKELHGAWESISAQIDDSAGGGVIRECARLNLECASLRKRVLRSVAANVILAASLGSMSWIFFTTYPKYRYIPVTNAGAICEVSTENNPRVTPAHIMDWASNTAVQSYSYNYVDWRDTLERVGNTWYTQTGKVAFRRAMAESSNLERIRRGRYIVRATVARTPILKTTNKDSWVVEVPLLLDFFTGDSNNPITSQKYLADVTVVRVPITSSNLRGIATESLVIRTGHFS